jgi:ribose-phosphate pyrophosphokinase
MSRAVLMPFPGNERLGSILADGAGLDPGAVEVRRFPDGESYVRLASPAQGRAVAFLCTLVHPDDKLLPLLFAASTARELGATAIGLVCPYLAYMRQDRRFKPGEAVTSRTIATLLSRSFDWIITVDPHLHRYASLNAIYSVPCTIVHAAPLVSRWVRENIARAILVGPDSESEQWVSAVAEQAGVPFTVLDKTRHGDRAVTIRIRDADRLHGRAPVLIDDIISSGRTMLEAARRIRQVCGEAPVCIGVHGIFADDSDKLLEAEGARVVTCNTIPHPSNAIDISELLVPALRGAVQRGR